MHVSPHDMTTYWNRIGEHDLTLMLDGQGRLWKFRQRRPAGQNTLDASLHRAELVITEALPDERVEVDVEVHDHVVSLCCGDGGSELRSRVALPERCGFDEARVTTSRTDGSIEIHVPLAVASPATPAVIESNPQAA